MKTLSVRLTTFGRLFLLILFPMFIGAINYNNSLAYLLVFVCLSLYLLTFYQGWQNLKDIKINLYPLNNQFSGNSININTQLLCLGGVQKNKYKFMTLEYYLHQYSIEPSSEASNLHSTIQDKVKQYKKSIPIVNFLSEKNNQTEFKIKADRRGCYKLNSASCTSQYPLALFKWTQKATWSTHSTAAHFYVYPEPIDWLKLEVDQEGAIQNKTGTDQFKELSRYQVGDALAKVCWKTYARTEQLMTKSFEEDFDKLPIMFDWNDLERLSTEQKLSQLCYWVKNASQQGLCYGVNMPDHMIEPNSGAVHYHKCLVAMALY